MWLPRETLDTPFIHKDSSWIPYLCVPVFMLSHFSSSQLFETVWMGSSVHGILQTGILEWVAISSSGGSFQPRDRTPFSRVSCIGRRVLLPLVAPGKPPFPRLHIYKLVEPCTEQLLAFLCDEGECCPPWTLKEPPLPNSSHKPKISDKNLQVQYPEDPQDLSC